MKKSILTAAAILITSVLMAQSKTKTLVAKPDTTKPKYEYFIKVSVKDFQMINQYLNQFKNLIIYDPKLNSDQKVGYQLQFDQFVGQLNPKLKVDSLKIK